MGTRVNLFRTAEGTLTSGIAVFGDIHLKAICGEEKMTRADRLKICKTSVRDRYVQCLVRPWSGRAVRSGRAVHGGTRRNLTARVENDTYFDTFIRYVSTGRNNKRLQSYRATQSSSGFPPKLNASLFSRRDLLRLGAESFPSRRVVRRERASAGGSVGAFYYA